ncbi:MAG: DUF3501 family protein [Steroidobacteraceae bacterium]
MNGKLKISDLYSLEQYAKRRPEMRAQVLQHKQLRTVLIGPNMTWLFEDRLTMQYQVQEMLRVERIFEETGILEELAAYNPMIPDGSNWKVTCLIEFTDVDERRAALARMKGVEDHCWVQVGSNARVYAIADEDMERSNDDKTSAVHFMRFELNPVMVEDVKANASISMGVDHPAYTHQVSPVSNAARAALDMDLV